PILHIVAEDPEVEHIPGDVQQVGVQEHRGQQRDVDRLRLAVRAPLKGEIDVVRDGIRNGGEGCLEAIAVVLLGDEDDDVENDKRVVDERETSPWSWVVADWNHEHTSSRLSVRPGTHATSAYQEWYHVVQP